MLTKIFGFLVLVVASQAVHEKHATSYAQVTQHLIHSAPAVIKAAPVEIKAAPILHKAPSYLAFNFDHNTHISHNVPAVHEIPVEHHAPQEHHHKAKEIDYHSHPKYEYKYGIEDHHTGDIKSQEEHRDGDVVKGSYSLVEPDGTHRIVHYTADKHNGFNAVVERKGHANHPEHVVKHHDYHQ